MKNIFKLLVYYSRKRRKGVPFLVFFSFLITFAIARGFVILTNNNVHLIVNGYHIHHVTIGFIFLAVAGAVALGFRNGFTSVSAILYGIGLGLIVDEFGLLISWGNYWSRFTYDLFVIVLLIFVNILLFSEFWKSMGRKMFVPLIERYERKWERFARNVERDVEWYLSGKKTMKMRRRK